MPAPNMQFATSGGASRPRLYLYQHFQLSSEPLRYPRLRQAATTLNETLRQPHRNQTPAKTYFDKKIKSVR